LTSKERVELIEDIRRSAHMRIQIVEQARINPNFDMASAWESLEALDDSILTRIVMLRKRDK
jgi:hypothetical protein